MRKRAVRSKNLRIIWRKLVEDMGKMIRFYRDVLGFEIKEEENTSNVYLVKDGTLFLLYGRKDFEKMTSRRYEYIKGLNGHFERWMKHIRRPWKMERHPCWNQNLNLGDREPAISLTLKVI